MSIRAAAFFLAAFMCFAAPAAAERVAIIGATVIDGTGAPPLPDTVVVIDDARIASVGPRATAKIPAGAEVIDASGQWLIPGLIDAHVHLSRSASLYSAPDDLDLRAYRDWATDEVPRTRAALPHTLARYIVSGVTSVIDRGGPFSSLEIRAFAEAQNAAPRIALSGPMLTTYRPSEADRPDATGHHIETPDQARAMVSRLAAAGVDLIKIHFVPDGTALDATLAWVRAAVEEAGSHGLPVTVHATRAALARAVIEVGASQLVHSVDDYPVDEEFVRLLSDSGAVYTTTLLVYEGYREVFTRQLDYSDIELRLGDPAAIATLDDLATIPQRSLPGWVGHYGPGRDGRQRQRVDLPHWLIHNVQTVMAENLRRLAAGGVTIAAGTDAGTVGNLHGPALHRELELMADAGLPPLAIIRAATLGGATAMRRAADLGTIEPGKLADLVVLDADPLADITNTRRIHRVVKGGEIFDPDALMRSMGN